MRIVLFMAKSVRGDEAAEAAARAAERREVGGASARAGETRAADATVSGAPEQEGRPPEHEAGVDEAATPRPKAEPRVPGHHGERGASPAPGASAQELLGERSDYPILYGEDPGDIGQ